MQVINLHVTVVAKEEKKDLWTSGQARVDEAGRGFRAKFL